MELSAKTKNFLIASFSLAIIIVFVCFWHTKTPKTFIFPQKMPTWQAKRMAHNFVEVSGPLPMYNYDHMLQLLGKFKKIELDFYSDFDKFTTNPENIQKIQNILNELKIERELFNQFYQKMNTFFKRTMPTKKCKVLRYHLRSVSRAIDDLENFLKKIQASKKT